MESLTYQVIDELEFAFAKTLAVTQRTQMLVRSLGPLIQLQRSPASREIISSFELDWGNLGDASEFIKKPSGIYLDKGGSFGLAAVRGDDTVLELMQRALFATKKTAFAETLASQAISALGELASNIEEHSADPNRGIIGFEIQKGFVGIYASDLGMGVLNSLRKNPAYSALDDSGEALRLALQEGVSKSGEDGRGMGFRPIFVGLASLSALLRFRSGDSLLDINSFGGGTPSMNVRERTTTPGFHALVHCALK